MWLHMMRTRGIYNVSELSLGPLIELSQEMREKKIDPLQTEHFSFITDIPLKRRSKLYGLRSKLLRKVRSLYSNTVYKLQYKRPLTDMFSYN